MDIRREKRRASVLVVDDEPAVTALVARQLRGSGYECDEARSAADALALLDGREFDVVIADIRMPHVTGIELLQKVKDRDPEVQVIIMTGNPDVDLAVEAIRSQADDYLVKPFELGQLNHSLARALEHQKLLRENRRYRRQLEKRVRDQAQQIERLFLDGLSALAAAIEARDRYTGGHLDRVTRYALSTAREMGLSDEKLWNVWLGSLFHDVGKLAIPDAILNKPGPLTAAEYESIKRHPKLGVQIVERISFLVPATRSILHHQERWDGQGYPAGLKGDEISIEGRILAVADAYDAMVSERPYRTARDEELAVEELRRCAGTQFDPEVIEAFLRARKRGFRGELPATRHPAIKLAEDVEPPES